MVEQDAAAAPDVQRTQDQLPLQAGERLRKGRVGGLAWEPDSSLDAGGW